jgi:hypothetical protein
MSAHRRLMKSSGAQRQPTGDEGRGVREVEGHALRSHKLYPRALPSYLKIIPCSQPINAEVPRHL